MHIPSGVWYRLAVACLCCMAWPHAGSAAGPSFTCQKAVHHVEKLICADPALAALDVEMAKRYKDTLAKAPADDKPGIQIEQERWLKSRNTCAADAERPACVRSHYQARIERLSSFQALYASGSDAATTPGSPVSYQCVDRSEVAATFIKSEPPTARIKRGDSQWQLALVPTGSGSKYSNGQVTFWTKGPEALFEAGGKSLKCKEAKPPAGKSR